MNSFRCNITGNIFQLEDSEKSRELGIRFGYNCRFRAICYVFTKLFYGECKIMKHVVPNKNIKGIGMSDSGWANLFAEKFNYINTFYHMPPYLDIYNTRHVAMYNHLDFIISSDVFEHISPYPGIQFAFDNLYMMLRPGGFIIFSVPFVADGEHKEHYPNLFNYEIKHSNNEYILYNTTKDGNKEEFNNLCFHGGPGDVLEMRIFSKKSLLFHLEQSGFVNIIFNEIDEDMNKYGIFWGEDNHNSVIITAQKPIH